MEGNSLNIKADLIAKLKEIIPAAFTEDKLDVAQLKQLLGESNTADSERYQLNWLGKSDAYKVLQQPTYSTLKPQFHQSIHWENTENIFIEGDNLEVLKTIQKSYFGQIKMIYIDPPYNTGSDSFIYADKFAETQTSYAKKVGDKDADGLLTKEGIFKANRKENGQFHSNWLSMMLPRLFLARNLLKQEGLIFISIDDNEYANLKLLMNEVFGEENFVTTLMWRRRKTQANLSKFISPVHDYILCYARQISHLKFNKLPYSASFIAKTFSNPDNDSRGVYQTRPLAQPDNASNAAYELQLPNGRKVTAKWSCSAETFKRYVSENRLYIPKDGEGMPRLKIFLSEMDGLLPNTWLDDVATNEEGSKEIAHIFGSNAYFTAPKPINLIKHLLKLGTDADDIVIDFFAGSGSTAHAVLQLNQEDGGNRKFIGVQLPEPLAPHAITAKDGFSTIADIAVSRIQRVIQQMNKSAQTPLGVRVFKLAPSNFKRWQTEQSNSLQGLIAQIESLNQLNLLAVSEEDMMYELMLKLGEKPSAKYSVKAFDNGKIYHCANLNIVFSFCALDTQQMDYLLALKPMQVYCADAAFAGKDSAKLNVESVLQANNIDFQSF